MATARPTPVDPKAVVGRFVLAGMSGALAGGLLHEVAAWSASDYPPGWRQVTGELADAWPTGLRPRPDTWTLRGRTAWFSRASLPGRGLRTLSLEVELPEDGLLDIWTSRRSTDRPSAGDLLLRVHHPDEPAAQMLTWGDEGARPVSCVPAIQLQPGRRHAVGIEAAEGLINLTIDGEPSVCAAVGGPHPPALQAGAHGVRVANLTIDGRVIPAPNPGPLALWVFIGGLLSVGVSRLELTSGAGFLVSALGDLCVVAAALVAWSQVHTVAGGGLSIVFAPMVIAGVVRLTMHVGRALRPIPHASDWTPAAAVGAFVPATGLLALGTAEPMLLPVGVMVGSSVAAAAGWVFALHSRGRPWRALALMGGLVSLSTLLARVLADEALVSVVSGAGLGLGLAALAGSVARTDRHPLLRAGATLVAVTSLVLGGEFVASLPADTPSPGAHPPAAPVGPLPVTRDGGVIVTGPLAVTIHERGHSAPHRALAVQLGRPVLPAGDASWGAEEVAAALAAGAPGARPDGLVLTARYASQPPELFGAVGPLPGLATWWRSVQPRPVRAEVARIEAAVERIARAVAPSPVVLVTGTHGPDAAPALPVHAAFANVAEAHPHVYAVDFAQRVEAHPDQGWTDHRGVLADRAWAELAHLLSPALETP